MARGRPGFTEQEAREAISASRSWTESLRRLNYCPSGGNSKTLKKYAALWGVSTDHFDPYAGVMERLRKPPIPLDDVMVEGSTYARANLKRRLYAEGLKEPRCELCGQDENWRGRCMAMILDHKNGVRDDHRLENLQIVCPNCAATLDTHCGRAKASSPPLRNCARCGSMFRAKYRTQRPPYEKLMAEIEATSYCAVGRKYGVSDNAVRKWVRFYEREAGSVRGGT